MHDNSTTQSILTQEVTAKDRLPFGIMLETTDYSLFQTLKGNRDITPERYRKIEESMLTKQLPIPIVINEKREVIDGQGRLEVCKNHSLPVFFIVIPNLTIDDCVTVNIYSKNWSQKDIIRRYAIFGDHNYQNLLDLMEKYHINLQLALIALGKSSKRTDNLNLGKMSCTDEDKKAAEDRMDKALEVLNELALAAPIRQRSILVQAIIRCTKEPGYDHNRMKSVCHKYAAQYRECPTVADTLQLLATFYNRAKKSDYMDTYGNGTLLKVVFDSQINRFTKTK